MIDPNDPATSAPMLSLAQEITLLRAVLTALETADDTTRRACAERAAETARVVSVLIHAVESERAFRIASQTDTHGALSGIIARAIDALAIDAEREQHAP